MLKSEPGMENTDERVQKTLARTGEESMMVVQQPQIVQEDFVQSNDVETSDKKLVLKINVLQKLSLIIYNNSY